GKLKDLPNGAQLLGAAREVLGLPKLHAEQRVIDADRGEAVALAALAEAIGLDACHPLDVPDVPLPPAPAGVPDRAELLRLIEARTRDRRRARLTEQITRLEADAQKQTSCGSTDAFTFASAADIHAHTPPAESADGYRPTPMLPEMPVRLVGSRDARVRSAELFAANARHLVPGLVNPPPPP